MDACLVRAAWGSPMPLVCPTCGLTSQDREFCDHCNADFGTSGVTLPGSACPWPGENIELTSEERAYLGRPEAWIEGARGKGAWRIHWIAKRFLPQWRAGLDERQQTSLPCLAPCHLLEEAAGAWVVIEAGGRPFVPWLERPYDDALDELRRLLESLERLTLVLEALHAADLT